ncbi:MAG TPA: hypothetical protein EYG94_04900 [Campylobacterales bacterium]|nr:hypothetical protein [Campylobacterales bacterium]
MNKQSQIEEFNNVLENDALLDIFTTAGLTEEINQDSFEVSSSKNLTILILASGLGGETISELISSMTAEHALKLLEDYQYDQKSSEEIILFLKSVFLSSNDLILDYLTTANIEGHATTLSIVLIYKNSLYTAHIGESRIYVVRRDDTPTLLSKDPSYSQNFSKNVQERQESSFLGDDAYDDEKVFVTHEANLRHKEKLILCNKHSLESIPENKFDRDIEEIETIIQETPPLINTTFLRYTHYERSIEKIKISMEDISSKMEESEIDWERIMPIIKKIALVFGVILILGFAYLAWQGFSSNESVDDIIQQKPVETHNSIELIPVVETELPKPIVHPTLVKKEVPKLIEPLPEIPVEKSEAKQGINETFKLLQKEDSTILHLGKEGIRITFKNDRLVASKIETFQINPQNTHEISCELKGIDSKLNGDITSSLEKQIFSEKVIITSKHNKVKIKIKVKDNCGYTQSNWAKDNGLDLFIFTCEEAF